MKIIPMSPNLGAIIYGVNLAKDLTDEMSQQIKDLILEYQVIFFREQDEMTGEQYSEMVRKIYPPMEHPFISKNEPIVPGISPFQPYTELSEITGIHHNRDNKGNLNEWHSDLNWLKEPSLGSALRAMQLPELGGDTLFASMQAAYTDLPESLKEQCGSLRAYHDFMQIYHGIFGDDDKARSKMRSIYPRQAHPIILKHPLSGKKSIFVNRVSTTHIVGMPDDESNTLLEHLYKLATLPEYQIRYQWQVNDIAFWDNLATQHYATSDYWPAERKMERISLKGIPLNQ